jgi:GTP 3',8-cyclase
VDPLVDSWGREIKSVRVSVTDKCNFRCRYCMPAEGLEWLEREELLSFEEVARLVHVLAAMGVEEVRLTGGEPLVRRDLPVLVRQLSEIPGVNDLSLTTNGVLLDKLAGPLVEAGLRRLNVSLDSLSHVRFAEITRRDALDRVLAGLEEAERYPELGPIKVNCVAMRGFTEEEVPALAELARRKPYIVRFIEFMPLDADESWRGDDVLTGGEIRALIEERWPLEEIPAKPSSTARRYRFADGAGEIGFVNPVSEPFCSSCDRIRLTADGQLRTCLFSRREWDLKTPLRDGAPDAEIERPLRRPAQGAEAQDQRPGLRARVAINVSNRRLRPDGTVRVKVELAAVLALRRVVLREAEWIEARPRELGEAVGVRARSAEQHARAAHALEPVTGCDRLVAARSDVHRLVPEREHGVRELELHLSAGGPAALVHEADQALAHARGEVDPRALGDEAVRPQVDRPAGVGAALLDQRDPVRQRPAAHHGRRHAAQPRRDAGEARLDAARLRDTAAPRQ